MSPALGWYCCCEAGGEPGCHLAVLTIVLNTAWKYLRLDTMSTTPVLLLPFRYVQGIGDAHHHTKHTTNT